MTAPSTQSRPAARTATALALAEAARQVQIQIRRALMSEVTRLWPLLTGGALQARWPAWLQAMTALLTDYHNRSATAGRAYYLASKAAALGADAAGSLDAIPLALAPSPDWMTQSLGYAAAGMLLRSNLPPDQRNQAALTQTLGTATRIALSGGRDTIADAVRSDPGALGWWRKTDASPCYFCAMLASRGVVYKSHSFDRSNSRFDGDGTSKVHNHCGCMLAPAFSRDMELPETNKRALQVYQDSTGGVKNADRLKAFRRAWEGRAAA